MRPLPILNMFGLGSASSRPRLAQNGGGGDDDDGGHDKDDGDEDDPDDGNGNAGGIVVEVRQGEAVRSACASHCVPAHGRSCARRPHTLYITFCDHAVVTAAIRSQLCIVRYNLGTAGRHKTVCAWGTSLHGQEHGRTYNEPACFSA